MIQERLKELVANPPPAGKLASTLEALAKELETTYMYVRKEYYRLKKKQESALKTLAVQSWSFYRMVAPDSTEPAIIPYAPKRRL